MSEDEISIHTAGRRPRTWRGLVLTLAATVLLTGHSAGADESDRATGAATVAASAVTQSPASRQRSQRPNIVVVMADDMRVDDMRFAPHVRKLIGADGLTFENSFAPFPLCCPARASFLTGQYAHNHGVLWHTAPYGYGAFDDSRTLATSLRAAGYSTGMIGKYLNLYGSATSKVSGRPSFDYVPRGWDDWRVSIEPPRRGTPGARGIHGSTYHYFDTPFNVNGHIDNSYRGRYQSNVIGDFSVTMARRFAASEKPFFMYVNYVAPHFGAPREADDTKYRTPARPAWVKGRFDATIGRGAGMPRDGGPSEADISDKPRYLRILHEPDASDRQALKVLTRQRAESIYVMDQQVERLVKSLKATGEWSNTVLMFTSDNGYYLGEHRRPDGKVNSHEPSLRTPFLVTGPGMRDGSKRYDPISTIDISATILDFAGAAAPRPADGLSRATTMLDGDQGWTTPVVTESARGGGGPRKGFVDHRTGIGVRTPQYSMTLYRTGEHELYDLAADPLENENAWSDPAYRAVRKELLTQWWATKDCAATECQVALPLDLQADPVSNADATRAYWAAIDAVYGWR